MLHLFSIHFETKCFRAPTLTCSTLSLAPPLTGPTPSLTPTLTGSTSHWPPPSHWLHLSLASTLSLALPSHWPHPSLTPNLSQTPPLTGLHPFTGSTSHWLPPSHWLHPSLAPPFHWLHPLTGPTLSLAPPSYWPHPGTGATLLLAPPSFWPLTSFQALFQRWRVFLPSAFLYLPVTAMQSLPTHRLLGRTAGACKAELGSRLQLRLCWMSLWPPGTWLTHLWKGKLGLTSRTVTRRTGHSGGTGTVSSSTLALF